MEKENNNKNQSNFTISKNHELWVLLERSHFAVARARDMELSHYGLTPAQAAVLFTLLRNGGSATQAEIANFTTRQHHSVSTLINRMIKTGLIEKIKAPKGNKALIKITEKGTELYSQTTRDSLKMVFSALTNEQKNDLAALLELVRKKARNLLGLDYTVPFLPKN